MNGARYRLSIDLCEEETGYVSVALIREVLAAMKSAAKVTIPQEHSRKVKIDPTFQMWHAHRGESGCTDCVLGSQDGRSQDVSAVFPARPSA